MREIEYDYSMLVDDLEFVEMDLADFIEEVVNIKKEAEQINLGYDVDSRVDESMEIVRKSIGKIKEQLKNIKEVMKNEL